MNQRISKETNALYKYEYIYKILTDRIICFLSLVNTSKLDCLVAEFPIVADFLSLALNLGLRWFLTVLYLCILLTINLLSNFVKAYCTVRTVWYCTLIDDSHGKDLERTNGEKEFLPPLFLCDTVSYGEACILCNTVCMWIRIKIEMDILTSTSTSTFAEKLKIT